MEYKFLNKTNHACLGCRSNWHIKPHCLCWRILNYWHPYIEPVGSRLLLVTINLFLLLTTQIITCTKSWLHFLFKSTCLGCWLKRNPSSQEPCIRKRLKLVHLVFCLTSHAIYLTWILLEVLPLLLLPLQMVKPINKAIQKFMLSNIMYNMISTTFTTTFFSKPILSESVLDIMSSTYN